MQLIIRREIEGCLRRDLIACRADRGVKSGPGIVFDPRPRRSPLSSGGWGWCGPPRHFNARHQRTWKELLRRRIRDMKWYMLLLISKNQVIRPGSSSYEINRGVSSHLFKGERH